MARGRAQSQTVDDYSWLLNVPHMITNRIQALSWQCWCTFVKWTQVVRVLGASARLVDITHCKGSCKELPRLAVGQIVTCAVEVRQSDRDCHF